MAFSIKMKIDGVKDIQKAFNSMSKEIRHTVSKAAAQQAANIIINEAKRLVPVVTGNLKRSIKANVDESVGYVARAEIGPSVEYGKFVEFGTKGGYPIYPKNARVLYRAGAFGPVAYVLNHPGVKPRPYMRPAFDNKIKAATTSAGKVFVKLVAKYTKGGK